MDLAQLRKCDLAICRAIRIPYEKLYLSEAATHPENTAPVIPRSRLPLAVRERMPFRQKTLLIWYREGCVACENSKDFFKALERNKSGYDVHRIEATDDNKLPHVLMVPMYDLVFPELGADSAYGPNTRLVSILNNDQTKVREYILPSS